MAKRRMLQWMRDQLNSHAIKVVIPASEKRVLDAAYAKASTLVRAVVAKKFPPAEMKILRKWKSACSAMTPKLQLPDGSVVEFKFLTDDDAPLWPGEWDYKGQIYLADAPTAAAVDRWKTASDAYEAERKKRLAAYEAMIIGSSYVEDIIELWPEAKGILPAGSPPIALGPEQIATVRADLRERKAA
jgi:hypothetical protein